MTYTELYKAIGDDLAKRLLSAEIIDEDNYNDIIEDDDFKAAYDSIKLDRSNHFQCIIDLLKNFDEAKSEEEVPIFNHFYHKSVGADEKGFFKDINVYEKDAKFALTTSKNLFYFAHNKRNSQIEKIVELILGAIHQKPEYLDQFYDCLKNENKTEYLIISDKEISALWDAYAYAYLLSVNETAHDLPEEIKFKADQKYSESIEFDNKNVYSQYFETYHLISESHATNNLLHRFLVMYQILENFCYRQHLVEIVNSTKKAIVRKIIAFSTKASDKESSIVPNGIKSLISTMSFVDINLNNYSTFLTREYRIDPTKGDIHMIVAKTIYAIRNSIVHNKATELHFSTGNISEYGDIIPLMKDLINKIEPRIIELVNDKRKENPIRFDLKEIKLY
jgi:hypothetical protein